jgi:hypothetical protein
MAAAADHVNHVGIPLVGCFSVTLSLAVIYCAHWQYGRRGSGEVCREHFTCSACVIASSSAVRSASRASASRSAGESPLRDPNASRNTSTLESCVSMMSMVKRTSTSASDLSERCAAGVGGESGGWERAGGAMRRRALVASGFMPEAGPVVQTVPPEALRMLSRGL